MRAAGSGVPVRRPHIKQREGAENAGVSDLRRRLQQACMPLRPIAYAQQAHTLLHLRFEQLKHTHHTSLTAGSQRPTLHAPQSNDLSAHQTGLHNVAPSVEASVNPNRRAAFDCSGNLGQNGQGTQAVIQLPTTVVGDIDQVDAVIQSPSRRPRPS